MTIFVFFCENSLLRFSFKSYFDYELNFHSYNKLKQRPRSKFCYAVLDLLICKNSFLKNGISKICSEALSVPILINSKIILCPLIWVHFREVKKVSTGEMCLFWERCLFWVLKDFASKMRTINCKKPQTQSCKTQFFLPSSK